MIWVNRSGIDPSIGSAAVKINFSVGLAGGAVVVVAVVVTDDPAVVVIEEGRLLEEEFCSAFWDWLNRFEDWDVVSCCNEEDGKSKVLSNVDKKSERAVNSWPICSEANNGGIPE